SYIYDFGDWWDHRVTIEQVIHDYPHNYPQVIKIKGNIPPEDCGGIHGYYELLRILDNPNDPMHEEMSDWMEMMSPLECNMEDINDMLELLYLTDEIHLPMGKVDLYDRFNDGQPFYRIVTEEEWRLSNDRSETKMAGLDEWKQLYEVTERIKTLEPWKDLWDVDIIGVPGVGEREDTFISVLGRTGSCLGLCVYEGVGALNQFFMIKNQEQINANYELLVYKQNALVCYWGSRDELSKEQYQRVKELGYKYRGNNQWLYFLSFKEGYYPCDLNAEEVSRMLEYMKILETALSEHRKEIIAVNFDKEKCAYIDAAASGKMVVTERDIPMEARALPVLQITDELMIARLKKAKSSSICLEAEVIIPGVEFKDPRYSRHINMAIGTVVDAESGVILLHEVNDPGEDPFINMADAIVEYTLNEGAPAEVHVSNEIMAAALDHVCKCAGIKLVKKNKLKHTNEMAKDFIDFMKSK
ncbi:MAG: plasmid pRiA4b ORF-3 family protein, partial [Agathobacter sp.]